MPRACRHAAQAWLLTVAVQGTPVTLDLVYSKAAAHAHGLQLQQLAAQAAHVCSMFATACLYVQVAGLPLGAPDRLADVLA